MTTVRRWYFLLVCAGSLQAVAWAVIWLLRGILLPSLLADPELFSVQIAIIVIGLPIFLWHWSRAFGEIRSFAGDGRVDFGPWPIYVYGMSAGFIAPIIANAITLLQSLFRVLLNLYYKPLPSDLLPMEASLHAGIAIFVLAGLTLYFRQLDRITPATGDVLSVHLSDVRRGFLLVLSVVGLSLTSASLISLLRWLIFQIGGDGFAAVPGGVVVSEQSARLLVGLTLWQMSWRRAQVLFYAGRVEERESVLRKLYLYVIVFVGSLTVVTIAATLIDGLLGLWLELESTGDLRVALLTMSVFGLLWAYHALVLQRDADLAPDVPSQAAIRRLYRYILATIGLGAVLIGLGGTISVLIAMLSTNGFGDGLREQVAGSSAALVAGLPVWLLSWRKVQLNSQSAGSEGQVERRATIRKIYLYLFLFVATMTVLASTVVIFAQLLNLALGTEVPGDLLSLLAHAIAFSVLAAGLWLYHRACLREDRDREKVYERDHATQVRVVILVPEEDEFGAALGLVLRDEFPGLVIEQIAVTSVTDGLSADDVVIAPGDLAGLVAESPARKLLVPLSRPGWDWVGAPTNSQKDTIRETIHALRRLLAGQHIRPLRRLSGGMRVVLVIGAVLLMVNFVMALIMFTVNVN